MQKTIRIELTLFFCAIIFSYLTQLQGWGLAGLSNKMMYLCWIITGLLMLSNYQVSLNKFSQIYVFLIVWVIVCTAVAKLFSDIYFFRDPINIFIYKAFCIYMVSYLLHRKNIVGERELKTALLIMVLLAIVIGFYIWNQKYASVEDWTRSTELYQKKNSAGQILGVSVIVSSIYFGSFTLKGKWLKLIALIPMLFLITVKCRTALLATVIALLVASIMDDNEINKNKIKIRRCYILGGAFIVILCFIVVYSSSNSFRNFINSTLNIKSTVRLSNNTPFLIKLDTLTSYRLSWYRRSLIMWGSGIITTLFGAQSYSDNFYVNMLTGKGLLIGVPIIMLCIKRFSLNFKKIKILKQNSNYLEKNGILLKLVRAITVFFIVESFAEGYPPIGPGVSCLLFWCIVGYFDAEYERYIKSITNY